MKRLLPLLFLLAAPAFAQQNYSDPAQNQAARLDGGPSLSSGTVSSITLSAPTAGGFTIFGTNPITTFGTFGYEWDFTSWAIGDCLARTAANVVAGASCGGAAGAPTDATYITQTANGSLSAEQALSSLSTGIMRVATTTGVITSLTDSAGISGNISDETGSGALVFGTSPSMVTPVVGNGSTSAGSVLFKEDSDNGTNSVTLIGPASTADVTLTLPAVTGTVLSSGDSATALSVDGRSANSSGVRADIVATAAGNGVLRENGSVLEISNPWTDTSILYSNQEFINISDQGWACFNTGAGGSAGCNRIGDSNAAQAHPGVYSVDTGTSTTGRTSATMGSVDDTAQILIGGGEVTMQMGVKITTALSDGTDTYTAKFGLCDLTNSVDCTDGVFFRYNQPSDTHWQMVVCGAGSCTSTNTTTTVTLNQWYALKIIINAAGTSVGFYIDTVQDASSPLTGANIPVNAEGMGFKMSILKSAGTNGRNFQADYFRYFQKLTTAR